MDDLPPAWIPLDDGQVQVVVAPRGARLARVRVPDRDGRTADVVLSLADDEAYARDDAYLGATVGRCANRIRDGRFTIGGVAHQLTRNEGPTHLHGGDGFDQRIWDVVTHDDRHVRLALHSPDGDQGYPGALDAIVTYRLPGEGVLDIEMTATTDRATIVNLVNHTFWNLAGDRAEDILDHQVMVGASSYLPADGLLLPTGEVRPVEGTPLDLRCEQRLGDAMLANEFVADLHAPDGVRGFDACLVLDADAARMRQPAVVLTDPVSGRRLRMQCDQPALQLYTGCYFDGTTTGGDGRPLRQHAGVALESQQLPDAVNIEAFPTPRLDPGEVYLHRMRLVFDIA